MRNYNSISDTLKEEITGKSHDERISVVLMAEKGQYENIVDYLARNGMQFSFKSGVPLVGTINAHLTGSQIYSVAEQDDLVSLIELNSRYQTKWED